MTDIILSIDQGTTSSRVIAFDRAGAVVAQAQREFAQIYPQNGWVEHDGEVIWRDCLNLCRDVMRQLDSDQRVVSIGITNQRETSVIWDRMTGKPIYNAIVWQDRRTATYCKEMAESGHGDSVQKKTGLLLDSYFSATKIKWILDNVDGARVKAERGDLAFGTIECWLLWNLTGGAVHKTDATNAARTMVYNIHDHGWDDDLLALFDVPRALLPEIEDNAADFGVTDTQVLGQAIPIGGMAGDQHAAVIGQACFKAGMVKSTYGTGCFALMNTGDTAQISQNKLLTTPAYRLNGNTTYAIEGSIFNAGTAIQFLRDNFGFFDDAKDSEALATSVENTNGVYFVPAFTGLGAPHWNPESRGVITGLTRDTSRAHVVRAALEAQAYQTRDLMDAMASDSGITVQSIRADGGLVANTFMCQFLADILSVRVDIPQVAETTALGAAYLAGLQAGMYKDLDDIAENWQCVRDYTPNEVSASLYEGWRRIVKNNSGKRN